MIHDRNVIGYHCRFLERHYISKESKFAVFSSFSLASSRYSSSHREIVDILQTKEYYQCIFVFDFFSLDLGNHNTVLHSRIVNTDFNISHMNIITRSG